MTLGERIRGIRLEHGLSGEAFAEKLGTTRQAVSRWELDECLPELSKIVQISRLFSVSTDSILKEGISTFDSASSDFPCGVYRGANRELVESEKFALLLYASADKTRLGAKLYKGFENKKRLVALCERDQRTERTEYAFLWEGGLVDSGEESLRLQLGDAFDPHMKRTMRRTESFTVDHDSRPLPTVKEAGIPKCLTLWRMADSYQARQEECCFFLCTGKTEYIFSIKPENRDIYCGASYNLVFDLGLFGGGQFFRIRNYRDNRESWCGFFCDFSQEATDREIPTGQCAPGKFVSTEQGNLWCVKRYTDSEIVLQGCGEDEYTYRREGKREERFVL